MGFYPVFKKLAKMHLLVTLKETFTFKKTVCFILSELVDLEHCFNSTHLPYPSFQKVAKDMRYKREESV
jgi:hypothetical protein